MIQPQELQIGNLFNVAGIDRLVRVTAIFRTYFRCEDKDGVMFDESLRINYTPIPLTEEWLMKAGFVKPRYQKYYILNGVRIRWDNNLEYWEVHQFYLKQDMKYLHQLQNLYFALTGEELNIEI